MRRSLVWLVLGAAGLAVAAPALVFAGGSTAPGIVQSGTVTNGHCAQFSANGVAIDAGATCGAGTSGVSQATGTASQILINGDSAAHTGAITLTLPNGVAIGTAATATGTLGLNGITSGTVTIQPQSVAGTYNFNLPTAAGTSGQPLLSAGGGAAPMTFGTLGVAAGGTGVTTAQGNGAKVQLSTGTTTTNDCVKFDANGNTVDAGAVCGSGGTVTSVGISVPATSIFGTTGTPVTTSGTLGLTTTGTSGGIPFFSSGTQLATSAALTANLPVFGGGAGVAPASGTRSGNTTKVVTTTGALTTSDCAQWDAAGNLIDSGAACGAGGGTLTVTDGTHSVASTTTLTFGNGFLVSGSAGSATANLTVTDTTKTSNYSAAAGDMANALNLSGSGATLTLPAASATIFAPGMTLTVTVTGTGNWTLTNSTGLTLTGLCGTSPILPPGTSGTLVANADGTHLDFVGSYSCASVISGYLANVTTQSGATYTLANTDCGTFIKFTSGSAVTVTLPNSLSIGCEVAMEQNGAGQITLSPAAGATLHSAHSYTKSFAQFAVVGVTIDANAGGVAAIYAMTGDGA